MAFSKACSPEPRGASPSALQNPAVKLERLLEAIRPAPPSSSWERQDPRLCFLLPSFTGKQTSKHLLGASGIWALLSTSELSPPAESSQALRCGSPLWGLPGHSQSLSVPLTSRVGSWTPDGWAWRPRDSDSATVSRLATHQLPQGQRAGRQWL